MRLLNKTVKKTIIICGTVCLLLGAVGIVCTKSPEKHICTWSASTISRQATCTSQGERIYFCDQCHSVKTEVISKEEHQYLAVSESADCTQKGAVVLKCTVCGEKKQDDGEEYGHDYQKVYVRESPSCSRYSYYHMICSRCGEYGGEGMEPPLAHVYAGTLIQKGDCITPTVVTYACSVCEAPGEAERYLETDGHTWVTKESDLYWNETGKAFVTDKEIRCQKCNASIEGGEEAL